MEIRGKFSKKRKFVFLIIAALLVGAVVYGPGFAKEIGFLKPAPLSIREIKVEDTENAKYGKLLQAGIQEYLLDQGRVISPKSGKVTVTCQISWKDLGEVDSDTFNSKETQIAASLEAKDENDNIVSSGSFIETNAAPPGSKTTKGSIAPSEERLTRSIAMQIGKKLLEQIQKHEHPEAAATQLSGEEKK